jgi:MarR family transcriptional regulator, transcriptional regulator for hemolysin
LFLTEAGRRLVDDLDSLRDSIAADVLQGMPASTIETSLEALRDIKRHIKSVSDNRSASENPDDLAIK